MLKERKTTSEPYVTILIVHNLKYSIKFEVHVFFESPAVQFVFFKNYNPSSQVTPFLGYSFDQIHINSEGHAVGVFQKEITASDRSFLMKLLVLFCLCNTFRLTPVRENLLFITKIIRLHAVP